MAKICPDTGEKVLYLDCLDCEDKNICASKGQKCMNDEAYEISAEGKEKLIKKLWHYIESQDAVIHNTIRKYDDVFDEMKLSSEERCYLVFKAE